MANTITVSTFKAPEVLSASSCVIGSFYRRVSAPGKVYICSRDISRDTYGDGGRVISHGRVLVSLEHGNRITTNLSALDFIRVEGELKFKDVLS